jgi:hypothetical protein
MKGLVKVKKLTAIILFFCLIFLVSCGAPSEVKQEAKERLEKYKPIFEQKVKDVYGSDAKLKNVKCDVTTYVGSPVPSVSYSANKYLTGTINLNGRNYDASYDTLKNCMIDNVHTEDICSSVINALPLNSDKFIQVKYIDSVGYEPKFKSEVDSLEKAAESDEGNIITFVVITSEDLSSFKEDDFTDIPELQTITNSKNLSGTIKIVSIKDQSKASSLSGKIRDLNFSYDTHPMVYDSSGNKDAFDVYGIRNTISIKLNPGNLVYNYMD